MGAVLMQESPDPSGKLQFHPVAFASKSFIAAEINYSATERELRALVWATTEVFRHYLVGLPSYQLQGDHQPLRALLSAKEYSRRQYRWLERLAEYNVPVMEYVPGTQLVVPDALSRRADLEEILRPVRDSMSAQQRVEWGLVNPEATFGNAKAGPLPDVVSGPQSDSHLVIRPATLAPRPPGGPPRDSRHHSELDVRRTTDGGAGGRANQNIGEPSCSVRVQRDPSNHWLRFQLHAATR